MKNRLGARTWIAWAGIAGLWVASVRAQERPPDLTGRWQLNEKDSEDARAKFIWDGSPPPGQRPAPRGERRPGIPQRPERTNVSGSIPPAFRDFLEPAKTLVITGTVTELTFDEGRGVLVRLPLDGSEQKQDTLSRIARWDGSSLVVEAKAEGGGRLITRYNLMPGTRKLEVYSRLSDRQGGAITLRRVYDAETALGSPAAAPSDLPRKPAQSPDKPSDVPTFGVTTELVYVRFHVERKGGYVDHLSADQIRVLEDGRPQTVALLETPSTLERRSPPEVTLALDVSSSVLDAGLLDERLVKDVFLAGLSGETSVGLCAFGGELRCFAAPSRDAQKLLDAFEEAVFFGRASRGQGTRLYASVADICRDRIGSARSQRAVVIFSDGLDNHGGGVREAISAALEADVRVYAVKLSQAFQATAPLRPGAGFGHPPNRALYDYKKLDLGKLASETGGRAYEPATVDKRTIEEILRSIATEIAMEHVVGYQPQGPATGKARRVKVELADKSLGKIPDGERTLIR